VGWVSLLCGTRNVEFRPRIICGMSDAEKTCRIQYSFAVTKVVVYSLLNKRVATFTIVPYCQQIAEHSAPVIPQSIRGRIPHSIFTRVGWRRRDVSSNSSVCRHY